MSEESTRAKALAWWRGLSEEKQREVAAFQYSRLPFEAVNRSSSKIEAIYRHTILSSYML